MRKSVITPMIWVLFLCIFQIRVYGHSIDQVYMEMTPSERTFVATISVDASYCLPEFRLDDDKKGPGRSWLLSLSEEEHQRLRKEATLYIRESLKLMLEEQLFSYEVSFPDYDSIPYDFAQSIVDTPILRIALAGEFPPHGGSLQVHWNEVSEAYLLLNLEWQENGETKNNLLQVADGQMMDIGVQIPSYDLSEHEDSADEGLSIQQRNWFSFVKTGFDHILPLGIDHIAFVVGLFLCSPTWRPLLRQTLTFTVAHSITLALSLAGVISLNIAWVECIIALSIVYVAVENLYKPQVGFRRLLLVFAFGLLHGLGFGSVLGEYLPSERILWPLVGFNVGVELGQVVVLFLCFLIFGWFSHSFKVIRMTGSLLLGALGCFWVVERLPL